MYQSVLSTNWLASCKDMNQILEALSGRANGK